MGNKQQTSVSAHTGILTPLLVILYLYSGLLVAWFLGGTSSLELTRQLMAAWMLPLVVMTLGHCFMVLMRPFLGMVKLCVPVWTSTLQELKLQAERTAQLTATTAVHLATCSIKAAAAFMSSALSFNTVLMLVAATSTVLGVAIGLWVSLPRIIAYYRRAAKQALSPAASKLLFGFLAVANILENIVVAGVICYLVMAFSVELAAPKVKAAFCLACSAWRGIRTAAGAVKAWAVALKSAVLRVLNMLAACCLSMLTALKRTTAALRSLLGYALRSLDVVDAALARMEKVCSSCAVAPTAAKQHTTPANQQSTVEKLVDTSDDDAESDAESSAADVNTPPRTSIEEDLHCPAPAIGRGSGSSDSSGDSC